MLVSRSPVAHKVDCIVKHISMVICRLEWHLHQNHNIVCTFFLFLIKNNIPTISSFPERFSNTPQQIFSTIVCVWHVHTSEFRFFLIPIRNASLYLHILIYINFIFSLSSLILRHRPPFIALYFGKLEYLSISMTTKFEKKWWSGSIAGIRKAQARWMWSVREIWIKNISNSIGDPIQFR